MGADAMTASPKEHSAARIELVKAFLVDFVDDDRFMSSRRKLLRQRAGLTNKDTHKVPKWEFIIVNGKHIGAHQVESELNYSFILQYLASFAHDLPRPSEVKEALTSVSQDYKLNPFKEKAMHEAWADTEGGIIRAAMAYCLDRFQRNRDSRRGHTRMAEIKSVIRAKLQEHGKLAPDGRKTPTRGVGAARVKQEEAAQKAVSMDQVETQIQEHDSQYQFPSPISKLNLNCGHETEEDSSGDDGEEGAEEEMKTHDECIEPIEPHDPCTYLIESDGESVLSPRKAKVCPTPSEALPEVKEVPEPVAGSGAGAMLQDNLLDEPPPPSHEEQVYIEEAEAILDSDEEKKANKGVFKDRKPLTDQVEIPQDLKAQAEARLKDLGAEEHAGEILKAQAAIRQMVKEAAEDPDKGLAEMVEEEEAAIAKTQRRGKGRGRGRGKGRGRAASKKAADEEDPKGDDAAGEAAKQPKAKKPRQSKKKDAESLAAAESLNQSTSSTTRPPDEPGEEQAAEVAPKKIRKRKSSKRLILLSKSPSAKKKKTSHEQKLPSVMPEKPDEGEEGKSKGEAAKKNDDKKKSAADQRKDDKEKQMAAKKDEKVSILKGMAANDELLKLPSDLETVKSFTVYPPEVPEGKPQLSSIGVLLATTRSNTSSFQVSKVDCLEQRVQEANKNQPAGAAELQARKKGVTITWGTHGGCQRAWDLAKEVAGWNFERKETPQ
ncbi:Protein ZGRF1 [Durusdinium trenchii]|uniref:Protein ZGRF1 n=1 Tax=Durusdinium trenchii TaxID=1381693 RepID=A0ABP0L4B7_9DINO